MADPVVVKVSELEELTDLQSGDLITVVKVSETIVSKKTKKMQVGNLKLFNATQVVDGIITQSKIASNAINAARLTTNAVTTEKIVDGNVTTPKLANSSVTEAKLGTIKRTVVIRVTAPDDEVLVFNYGNFFPWPVTLNNFNIIDARINLSVPSSSGAVTVVLSNKVGTLATLSIAQGATGMAATGSISSLYKTALTNNFLGVNITGAGVGAKGLCITLVLEGIPV